MRIAVDLRSIQAGKPSGVENYALNALEHVLAQDTSNRYVLFFNRLRQDLDERLRFVNTDVVKRNIPSRLLNASLLAFGQPKFEKLVGNFDWLWLPNLNQFAVSTNTKVALTVHDVSPFVAPEFYDAKRRLWHRSLRFRRALARANVIFAVSEWTKKDLVEKFDVPEDKIVVTPLGVDHKSFHFNISAEMLRQVRNLYQLPGEFILYLGTVEPRKNIIGLIEAFNRLQHQHVWLVLAGRLGWKYGSVLKAIEQSPKQRQIRYIGFVEEADKPAILKLARVFAFPSFYEGFGLPPLEAMAVGTPVLASQVTSIPEVIEDAGLLINPYNIGDIATGLRQLLINERLRNQFIDKGLRRAQEFSWSNTAQKTLEGFRIA